MSEKQKKNLQNNENNERISEPIKNYKALSEVVNIIKNTAKFPLSNKTLTYLLYIIDTAYYEITEKQIMGMAYIKYNNDIFIQNYHLEQNSLSSSKENNILNKGQQRFVKLIVKDLNKKNIKNKKAIEDELKTFILSDIPFTVTDNHRIINYELVFYRDKKHSFRPDYDEDEEEYSPEFIKELERRIEDAVKHPETWIPYEQVAEELGMTPPKYSNKKKNNNTDNKQENKKD